MSFSYNDFELLKKQAAANNKKGVVGNNGTKIPIIPNVNDNKPNIVNIIFIFLVVKVQSSKFKVQSSKFRVQSSKFKAQSSMVQSSKLNGSKFKSSSHSISLVSYTYSTQSRAVLHRESLPSIPIGLRC